MSEQCKMHEQEAQRVREWKNAHIQDWNYETAQGICPECKQPITWLLSERLGDNAIPTERATEALVSPAKIRQEGER